MRAAPAPPSCSFQRDRRANNGSGADHLENEGEMNHPRMRNILETGSTAGTIVSSIAIVVVSFLVDATSSASAVSRTIRQIRL